MDAALVTSVAFILFGEGGEDGAAPDRPIAADIAFGTHPLDYGAYFDVALGGEANDPDHAEARKQLRHRWPEMSRCSQNAGDDTTAIARPAVTTLSSQFHSPADLLRFGRWWDIEPDNRMALGAVSDAELSSAQALIDQALSYLQAADPALYAELCTVVQEVVVTRPDGSQRMDFGGVSSFTLWGAISLNFDAHDGWPRYYQSLVHEAAHTLLFAIAREEPLVLNEPDETYASPLRADSRPMDGLFHAAFVSAREALALDALVCRHEDEDLLAPSDLGEVLSLLEGSVLAFWDCRQSLRRDGRISPLGDAILQECETVMRRNFAITAE